MSHNKFFLLGILCLMPTLVLALPSDREKPIAIKANTSDIDYKNGVAVYRGNVVITQGTTKITGDEVTMLYSSATGNRELQKIVAKGIGQRAYYEEEQPDAEGMLQAWGRTIDYLVITDKVTLLEQAQLTQKGDTFKGEQIDYDLVKQTINAKGGDSQNGDEGRVQMVIQPRPKNKQ